jgi:hypothetical protein
MGYLARQMAKNKLLAKLNQDRLDYYNKNANMIQKVWRGYKSRSEKFNFFKRRSYIKSLSRLVG